MAALDQEILIPLLGNGSAMIRSAHPTDTHILLDFDFSVKQEAGFQGMDPDEPLLTPSEKSQWISGILSSENGLLLVALKEEKILGLIECASRSRPRMSAHVLRFYVSVLKDYWGKGIGTQLIGAMESWARKQKVEKISLSVLSSNSRAINLYQKLGFTEEGRKRAEFRLPEGGFADEVFMAKFFKDKIE